MLHGFPRKGYVVWVGRLCLSVYLEHVKDFREVRPCCAAGFLSENAFTLNSKERQEVCLRAKCVIHIIRVKFSTSFHHLMPESELMLLPWSHNLLFFWPPLSPARQRFLILAAKRWSVHIEKPQSCHITHRWLRPLRMVRARAKICAGEGLLLASFLPPPIFLFLIVWGCGLGQEGKWMSDWKYDFRIL